MSRTQDPINWDHDDPIRTAAAQAAASASTAADRALQTAYMIQVMRTQRVQDRLEQASEAALARPDGVFVTGDRVRARDRDNIGHVVSVEEDGFVQVHFVNPDTGVEAVVGLSTGDLELLRPAPSSGVFHPNTPPAPTTTNQASTHQETTQTQPKPQAEPEERPLQSGDRVQANDRGNVGLVLSVDEETALVRFTNKQTAATKDVQLPLTALERTDSKQPHTTASGMLHKTGQPDPKRLKHTQAKGHTKPNRPGAWQQQQQRKPRPPKPKPT